MDTYFHQMAQNIKENLLMIERKA